MCAIDGKPAVDGKGERLAFEGGSVHAIHNIGGLHGARNDMVFENIGQCLRVGEQGVKFISR